MVGCVNGRGLGGCVNGRGLGGMRENNNNDLI